LRSDWHSIAKSNIGNSFVGNLDGAGGLGVCQRHIRNFAALVRLVVGDFFD
jgi:hypothetical protein